jgi:serine/threonine-protein kinase
VTAKGRLTPRETLYVVERAAFAIDYANSKGIIHGDINPGNILLEPRLGESYLVRVSDFGIAVEGRFGRTIGGHETLMATHAGYHPVYAAPEVLDGDVGRRRSDQYGLAAVAVTMLRGKVYPLRPELRGDLPNLTISQNLRRW